MSENAQQYLFDRDREPMSLAAQLEQAGKCGSRKHAWRMCIDSSGLEHKQIYQPLGVDQGKFSKYYSGNAFPDPDLLFPLMELCGNQIPLHYDAMQAACELVPIKTTLEEELAATKSELAEERRVNQRLVELVRGAK